MRHTETFERFTLRALVILLNHVIGRSRSLSEPMDLVEEITNYLKGD